MMKRAPSALSTSIQAKLAPIVKAGCIVAISSFTLLAVFARGDDDPPTPFISPIPSDTEQILPEIKARTFDLSILKRSRSKKTYLFSDVTNARPVPGRIFLLKRDGEPVMAFRVLKTNYEKQLLAAGRVRTYPGYSVLDVGTSLTAVEKLGDIIPRELTDEEKADLQELDMPEQESELGPDPAPDYPEDSPQEPPAPTPTPPPPPPVAPPEPAPENILEYDPELDRGSSPAPADKDEDDADEDNLPHSRGVATAEEITPILRQKQAVSFEMGELKAYSAQGTPYYPFGGGFRYSWSFAQRVFIEKPHLQDALTLDGGIFIYKIIGFESPADSYTVVPFVATLRYDLNFASRLSLYVYGGATYNRVASSSNATTNGLYELNTTLAAAGAGMLFPIGPQWQLRADVGIDMIAGGLMLRF